jgi:DMSO/TMAO reductase YedYZ molybdopterin-dependent catalytic subunit
VRVDSLAIYTNLPPNGAFRGYGAMQSVWASERTMDLLARELGMSPLALRRKNLTEPRLRAVLDAVQPRPEARYVVFHCADPDDDGEFYYESLDFEDAYHPQTILAYELNGKPLPRQQGAPVRVVIPEMYGYKNVKWVERIELVAKPGSGYWEQRGYDVDAWVGRSNAD